MALFCPKPCGRLATAAVFIAIGVIQLLVGVILLRSKYADLLSGADFLTSATNILIGCLYGVAASVWQNNSNKIPEKRTARKNTLAALLVTVITVNTTAVIVLLMSEGNKLLSLPYFNDHSGHSSVTFAKEVFASAYVTSVCSPIVCLVVALVALSGNCLQMRRTRNNPNHNSSNEKNENPFGWVFEEKSQSDPKVISDNARTSSQSSTSENSVFSVNSDSTSFKRKSILSVKNIPSPLHTWRQKRAKILRNDSLSRKCASFDARNQNTHLLDGLHKGLIPRIKDSSRMQNSMNITINHDASKFKGISRSSKEKLKSNTGFRHSSHDTDFKKVRRDSYINAILEENRINYETKLKTKCSSLVNKGVDSEVDANLEQKYYRSKSPENFRSVHSSVGETLVKSSYVNAHERHLGNSDVYIRDEVEDPEITRLKLQTLQELKKRVTKARSGSKSTVIRCSSNDDLEEQHKEKNDFKSSIHEQSSCNSPEKSSHSKENESSEEVFEPQTNSNVAIEYPPPKELSSRPASLRSYSPCYPKPLDLRTGEKINTEMKEGRAIQPNAFNYSSSAINATNKFQVSGGKVHSYHEKRNIDKIEQNPNVASSKLENKKREVSRRIRSMASIAEIPPEEGVGGICLDHSSSVLYSNRTASLDESSRDVDENSNITIRSSLSRAFSENQAFKKQRSFSPKGILKKMWSSAGPEVKLSVSDLIVDEDSLIGLSDEELLTRTLRIRSLRKVVEDRLKKENEMKNKINHAHAAN